MPAIDIFRLQADPHQTAFGIREDTSSRGVDLAGALVTATYADGTTEMLTWAALDPYTFGGATGVDIDMSFGFAMHEMITTKRLATLTFDLTPASSVFDTTLAMDDDPAGGSTLTSKNGFPFEVAPEFESLTGTIGVTYTGIVNLTGSAAVGDLFTTMIVDFSGLDGGGVLGDFNWNSDIDTMAVAGDLVPVPDPLVGTGGADSLTGGTGADTILGLGDDDTLEGRDGDDLIVGGTGNDALSGEAGADYLLGNGDSDTLAGDDGEDTLFGGAGADAIDGGADADALSGQGGDDTLLGGAGEDVLRGGSGDDSLVGGDANDTLYGNGNNDTLEGGGGDDLLQGAAGLDVLSGGDGADTLTGGVGADRLDGGAGDDVMNGGAQGDTFVYFAGYARDRINAFEQGGDRIELDFSLWFLTDPGLTEQEVVDTFGTLDASGTILTLDFGGGDMLEIQNASGIVQATLGADILFV